MIVEIVNPQGKVSYTRPHDHPDVMEALKTPGYSVRGSEAAIADSLQRVVRRQFPIMEGGARRAKDDLTSIPWEMIAPHDATARQNHGGQTLERLAQRGGLCPLEAVAVMEDADYCKRWPQMINTRDEQEKLTLEARAILKQMVANWMPPNACVSHAVADAHKSK